MPLMPARRPGPHACRLRPQRVGGGEAGPRGVAAGPHARLTGGVRAPRDDSGRAILLQEGGPRASQGWSFVGARRGRGPPHAAGLLAAAGPHTHTPETDTRDAPARRPPLHWGAGGGRAACGTKRLGHVVCNRFGCTGPNAIPRCGVWLPRRPMARHASACAARPRRQTATPFPPPPRLAASAGRPARWAPSRSTLSRAVAQRHPAAWRPAVASVRAPPRGARRAHPPTPPPMAPRARCSRPVPSGASLMAACRHAPAPFHVAPLAPLLPLPRVLHCAQPTRPAVWRQLGRRGRGGAPHDGAPHVTLPLPAPRASPPPLPGQTVAGAALRPGRPAQRGAGPACPSFIVPRTVGHLHAHLRLDHPHTCARTLPPFSHTLRQAGVEGTPD
ncbi:MAG: hypothetical protein J3K34DRAFT_17936 [Monoraphidium minutum]|nr:MAG: hypothetical protein J3K34DRAFT_17936 [Monoraphidium minutum]